MTCIELAFWDVASLALERHVQGRGPLPTPPHAVMPIIFGELPPHVADAYACLDRALRWSRVIGSEHHRDARGRSVEELLARLHKRHETWTRRRARGWATDDEGYALAIRNVAALIAIAPAPIDPDEAGDAARVLTLEERALVREVLGGDGIAMTWLDAVIRDLEERTVPVTPANIRRAKWRCEWRRRQDRRRERYGVNVDAISTIAPRAPTNISDAERRFGPGRRWKNDTGAKNSASKIAA